LEEQQACRVLRKPLAEIAQRRSEREAILRPCPRP
jgi:hypothetical protein